MSDKKNKAARKTSRVEYSFSLKALHFSCVPILVDPGFYRGFDLEDCMICLNHDNIRFVDQGERHALKKQRIVTKHDLGRIMIIL